MQPAFSLQSAQRLQQIADARHAVMHDCRSSATGLAEAWIERSWQRCLASGKKPDEALEFDTIAPPVARRLQEANHQLLRAARPTLEKLGKAIASSRYFAILTNAQGMVVDVNGLIDRSDRRIELITRIGADLSEPSVGTTAIGAALTELQPVWLHRGEHFFDSHGAYSCAGAPLFGADGRCAGMLDLTGVDTMERPELKHLVVQSARSIENALVRSQPHVLMIRLAWSGDTLGQDSDGLICIDPDGFVAGANPSAREIVGQLGSGTAQPIHCNDLFAVSGDLLFDAAKANAGGRQGGIELPLWSGLRVHALALQSTPYSNACTPQNIAPPTPDRPLRELETELIRQAVNDARGNVMKAARALGISRATVYRRLGRNRPD